MTKNVKQINLKFSHDIDGELIRYLETKGSPTNYIRYLIRRDMEAHRIRSLIQAGASRRS